MAPVVGWRIFYGGGRVLSSLDMPWWEAPAGGVQVVVFYFAETYQIHRDGAWRTENYARRVHSVDFYWLIDPETYGGGNWPDVPTDPPPGAVKLGKLVDEAAWRAAHDAAYEARTWP